MIGSTHISTKPFFLLAAGLLVSLSPCLAVEYPKTNIVKHGAEPGCKTQLVQRNGKSAIAVTNPGSSGDNKAAVTIYIGNRMLMKDFSKHNIELVLDTPTVDAPGLTGAEAHNVGLFAAGLETQARGVAKSGKPWLSHVVRVTQAQQARDGAINPDLNKDKTWTINYSKQPEKLFLVNDELYQIESFKILSHGCLSNHMRDKATPYTFYVTSVKIDGKDVPFSTDATKWTDM